jgi:hypothetical protein
VRVKAGALALIAPGGLLERIFPSTTAFDRLHDPLPVGEHRVHEVHVGLYRLLGEGLRSLRLALLLLGQSLGCLSVLLGLGVQVTE